MLLSLLHLVAVGLLVPIPVSSLPQLEPAALGHLIKALPPAHLVDWKSAANNANSKRGVPWIDFAQWVSDHKITRIKPAQWVSDLCVVVWWCR